ncbi:hypothetical protein BC834DRAFT_968638 [Gloeopeniophorella convolvens]|nr:hypothetical protein BC834DRAFT_968638 [Gloeopeniophorella convolvens]
MSAIRAAASTAKHTRALAKPLRRTFYSPFAALQGSALANTSSAPTAQPTDSPAHEHEHAARTVYVVSEPNAADFPYGVPAGAYPTSAPYHPAQPAQERANVSASSTSSAPAHPVLTRAAPSNPAGVGASAAVRYRAAPGEMAPGGEGGLGLADAHATRAGEDALAERNPPPIQEQGEEWGKLGNREAWQHRK